MSEKFTHQRVNDILLGPLERPALKWLAARTPAWVTPDMLTGFGFLASILIFASYWATTISPAYLWLASFGFVLNWFGDSLDGNVARFRKIERPRYGYFIDHTVDALAECLIFLGLGLSPYADFNLAALCLAAYLLMSNMVYISTYVEGTFRISYAKLGPTEVRLIAITANTIIFFLGNPSISLPLVGSVLFYNLVIIVVTLLLVIFYIYSLAAQARILNLEDHARQMANKARVKPIRLRGKARHGGVKSTQAAKE